jgi:hypothetical protein
MMLPPKNIENQRLLLAHRTHKEGSPKCQDKRLSNQGIELRLQLSSTRTTFVKFNYFG